MDLEVEQDQVAASLGIGLAEYDRIIDCMYEAALDPRALGRALGLVRGLFQANYATLILRASDEPCPSPMIVSGDIEGIGDPDGEVIYFTYHDDSNPFGNLTPDKVFTMEDLMSDAEWSRSTYYLMYCHPYNVFHTLGANITTPDGGTLRFRISRSRSVGRFNDRDRKLCELLLPHLRRAMHMYSLLDRSESLGVLYSQAIGRLSVATMVLDQSGSVLELNPVAREILASNDGLKLVGGRLEATYPSDNRELQRVLRTAFSRQTGEDSGGEAMSISRPSGQVSLGVVVESIPSQELVEGKGRPAAVVYIRDAVSKSLASTVVTKQLFNLTPAETSLALELANGLSLEEAAEELNIRRNTARAHLRSIFSKTGVRRQTELVRIMLNSVMALGSPSKPLAKPLVQPQAARGVGRVAGL
ncbi:helix-turn-helix transcriptional regulator [Pseudomonas sp. H9]|uniref:helix-turn-helix transcriptional regulator n=1 Tax=Pseudomonas sp. H9 TaxID=483968 RepID=UPI0021144803|nr:helix-turn-helix transcriptional regulator [Pseudomonas sp. H9]